jgi:hypothetical protein
MHLLGPITIFEHILGGCTCGDTSCNSWRYIFYYFMEFWHGQNPNSPLFHWICLVEMVHLLFWCLITSSCTFIHGVGCLGFAHGWLHASCGPLSIFGGCLWSIILGGIFYCYISHAPCRVHFVSSCRWTLKHILLD